MTFNNIFENKEFKTKLNSVKVKISNYLNEKQFDLGDLDIDRLILWHDEGNKTLIYPHTNCPIEIRNIVIKFIQEEFPQKN